MTPSPESNTFANGLLEMIRQAGSEAECMALSEKYAAQFKRLQQVNPARAHHIINLVTLRRIEFARIKEQENQEQADLFR